MYTKLILRGARFGLIGGLCLSSIFTIIIAIILAVSVTHSFLAVGYFFLFLLAGMFVGVMPATLVGGLSGMVVGGLVSLEIRLLSRLGTARVIFWRLVGLPILATLLVTGFVYRDWLLHWKMVPLILLVAFYFGGLIWVGWRLYHSSPSDPTPTRQVPTANVKGKGHRSISRTAINAVSIILGLVLTIYALAIIVEIIKYGNPAWPWQVALVAVGVCSIAGLRTMNKWGA